MLATPDQKPESMLKGRGSKCVDLGSETTNGNIYWKENFRCGKALIRRGHLEKFWQRMDKSRKETTLFALMDYVRFLAKTKDFIYKGFLLMFFRTCDFTLVLSEV